jgi:CRISPR-associated protein Cmr2
MRLRFTIGPVQELVRQSRRTRDLWASSFLLSYLSGCAMAGAVEHGRIILPDVERDELFQRIRSGGEGEAIRIGSLPNRFELETADPEVAANAARAALETRWKRICDAVWDCHLAAIASRGRGTEQIFRRQVKSFWEIQWVAAADEQPMARLLERRKAWRSRIPPEEPGDKCVVMPELQELSGYIRARNAEERERQGQFWGALKRHADLHDAELRPNERLSGLALIKRMYPRGEVATRALGWDPDAARWRSTVYVAAIPWIDEVMEHDPERCQAYAGRVCALDRRAEREIAGRKRTDRSRIGSGGRFAQLDANYFFVDALGNPNATLAGLPEDATERRDLGQQIRELYAVGGESPVGPPASFYALLLMDGDRVGSLLATLGGEQVSRALAEFTGAVAKIVEEKRGYAIYAGGDDVLAMLPVPQALACARVLRDAYRDAYRRCFGAETGATTSAAVVFAHVRQPLRQVLEEAHRLLDGVAKDRNGRDSVAVTLQRRSDRALEWATTWDGPNGEDRLAAVQALCDKWRGKAQRRCAGDTVPLVAGEISTGLMYRVRELMGMLCGWERWEPGICRAYAGGDPLKLLAAEIRRAFRSAGLYDGESGIEPAAQREQEQQQEAEEMAQWLLRVSHPSERKQVDGKDEWRVILDERRLGMDGAMLALFLSTDGKERDHGAMEEV